MNLNRTEEGRYTVPEAPDSKEVARGPGDANPHKGIKVGLNLEILVETPKDLLNSGGLHRFSLFSSEIATCHDS